VHEHRSGNWIVYGNQANFSRCIYIVERQVVDNMSEGTVQPPQVLKLTTKPSETGAYSSLVFVLPELLGEHVLSPNTCVDEDQLKTLSPIPHQDSCYCIGLIFNITSCFPILGGKAV